MEDCQGHEFEGYPWKQALAVEEVRAEGWVSPKAGQPVVVAANDVISRRVQVTQLDQLDGKVVDKVSQEPQVPHPSPTVGKENEYLKNC